MRQSAFVAGVIASAMLLCAPYAAGAAGQAAGAGSDTLAQLQQQIAALQQQLQQQQPKYTINSGSLAIESWLLTSTAIDSTADRICGRLLLALYGNHGLQTAECVRKQDATPAKVLVVAASDALDFGKLAAMQMQISAFSSELSSACQCEKESPAETRQQTYITQPVIPAVTLASSVLGLMKSDTELTAVDQSVDSKLLAAMVAQRLGATIPSAAAGTPNSNSALYKSFFDLAALSDKARGKLEELKGNKAPTESQKDQMNRLAGVLTRYDAFYAKATSPDSAAGGTVPLVEAVRLEQLQANNPLVLRVNTEKAGGTLVKRTNLVTALGGESVFITGGLVSSYQLSDPNTGQLLAAGVVTCRTTLTTLKKVQDASWSSANGAFRATPVCTP